MAFMCSETTTQYHARLHKEYMEKFAPERYISIDDNDDDIYGEKMYQKGYECALRDYCIKAIQEHNEELIDSKQFIRPKKY